MKIAILCSGVALGVYIPGLYIHRDLKIAGEKSEVFVLENLFTDEKKVKIKDNKKAFHDNFRVALAGQKLAADVSRSVDNDKTLEISAQQALVHARAGADMIAPSGMMDGIITTLRNALDENGFRNLPIMAYSTKFASGYYGPFRDVAESTPSFGDRRTYQMNPANRLEAIEESLEDEKEGADILMVKPALAFLDIVRDIRNASNLPLCVYNVSGEYAMLKHAGLAGLIDYERVMMETMIAFKRAGANIIISYHAKEVCEILRKQN